MKELDEFVNHFSKELKSFKKTKKSETILELSFVACKLLKVMKKPMSITERSIAKRFNEIQKILLEKQ